MIVTIAIVVLVVMAAVLIFVATRPAEFRVQRSALVNAPSDVVFAIINDLHQWERWSPYDKRDPNMTKKYEGPSMGPGASYFWSGNNDVGEGRMTVTESKIGEFVKMDLEFTRPFKGKNKVTFALAPSGSGTQVSWILDGKNGFMAKAFGLIMNMDTMIGKDFEEGLANLDKAATVEAQKVK